MSITRKELYRKFGPLLIEALVLIIKDEINILREKAGLEKRTDEQLLIAIENKLSGLEPYDWMNRED